MESLTESVDISSIKAAALRPAELPQADFEGQFSNDQLQPAQGVFRQSLATTNLGKSQSTHLHANGITSQPLKASASLPDLPSTVPDSQAIANVEQILQEIPNATVPQVVDALRKMSQGTPRDTQPLSPEFVETIMKSRRSTAYEEEIGYTHATLHEGDEGHIDLLSSYPREDIVGAEEDEFEPAEVEFSPTQSAPNRLSQFPESQRFKTPATVSRKRNHNGDLVGSPARPRNPLARNGVPTPAGKMNLSQAFAATQAASSPIIHGLTSGLRSDRPSPAFAIQPRPTTGTDSSPLLTRPLLPRNATEPQTKYISMQESQARREARKRMELDGNKEDDSGDSFNETPVNLRKRRAKKRRDVEAQRQFDAMSSIRKSVGPWSSPVRSSKISRTGSSPVPSSEKPVHYYLHSDLTSSPELQGDPANSSEEETEQEDEEEVAVRHSSQALRRAVPEEDKENAPHGAVQIPVTVELHRIMSGPAAEVEASPSVRHTGDVARSLPGSQRLEEVEALVANSQPSQRTRYIIHGPKLASSGEQTDFVPQSQFPLNNVPEESHKLTTLAKEGVQDDSLPAGSNEQRLLATNVDRRSSIVPNNEELHQMSEAQLKHDEDDEDEEPPRRNLRSQAANHILSSTIPETSSARLQRGISSSTDKLGETTKSSSVFETAPTHPVASSMKHDSTPVLLPSQTPAFTSPKRSKRKRMDEIDAEESQPRSSGPDLGELNPLLIDPDIQYIMGSSPIRPGRRAKRPRREQSLLEPHQDVRSSAIVTSTSDKRNIISEEKPTVPGQEPNTTQGETPPSSSDVIRTSAALRLLNRPKVSENVSSPRTVTTYGKTRSKRSAWDIQPSPEKPALIRSAPRTMSLRKPSTVLASTETRPGSEYRLRRAAMQHGHSILANEQTPVVSKAPASLATIGKFCDDSTIPTHTALLDTASTPICKTEENRAPAGDVVAPNQVLACYNGKSRAYYPARCLGVTGAETLRYQIQWDGYEPDELDERAVRSLDLRYGDSVKVDLEGFPKTAHVIRGFKDKADRNEAAVTDIRGYKNLLVAQKQQKSLPLEAEQIRRVPISAIYLDSNMWNQFRDRPFAYIAPPTMPSTLPGFVTPIDRPSTPSTPDSRSRRFAGSIALPPPGPVSTGKGRFANMAFAISYDNAVRKGEITDLITSNGGLVLTSGFHDLFQPEQLTLKPHYVNLGFTALLADKHSKKEKYLQALALGIPCLSGKWIEACVSRDTLVDWQSYLLPAGESEELEGAVRSRVLPAYDPAIVRVADVVHSSRANILDSEAIVFVLGRGKAEKKRRPYLFLTQAIGAGHIEKVSEIRAAETLLDEADGAKFKWVFVDDAEIEMATEIFIKKSDEGNSKSADLRVIGCEFIKQSLVLGRMFASE